MKVAIVGGGISGLSLAHALAASGVEPIVLEADDRAGGKIATREKDGFLLEAGPNGFLDKEPATLELAADAGLSFALRPAAKESGRRWIYLRGRLREVPTSPPAFLRSDIVGPLTKARLALEPFSRRVKAGVDESIGSFGRRHLGRAATRDLLGAMVLGIFGGDVEKLSLASCFPRMADLERDHRSLVLAMLRLQKQRKREAGAAPGSASAEQGPSGSAARRDSAATAPAAGRRVDAATAPAAERRPGAAGGPAGPSGVLTSVDGGLGRFASTLAERLGGALHLGTRVERIQREAGVFRLATAGSGGAAELHADRVVLAAPADEASRLLSPLDPALGEAIGLVPYAPMAVVHLAWPKGRIAHPLDGFGFLAPPHEGLRILGAIFVSSIFPWRAPEGMALFTVMMGGAVHPELPSLSEGELATIATRELAAIVGASGDPSLAEVVRWPMAIPQYVVGHQALHREVMDRAARIPGLHVGGNAWRGVGVNDCVAAARAIAADIRASAHT